MGWFQGGGGKRYQPKGQIYPRRETPEKIMAAPPPHCQRLGVGGGTRWPWGDAGREERRMGEEKFLCRPRGELQPRRGGPS